jgi:hypothetical protein
MIGASTSQSTGKSVGVRLYKSRLSVRDITPPAQTVFP